eukprot:1149032-Pelagomonas_calceolata.AAC.3
MCGLPCVETSLGTCVFGQLQIDSAQEGARQAQVMIKENGAVVHVLKDPQFHPSGLLDPPALDTALHVSPTATLGLLHRFLPSHPAAALTKPSSLMSTREYSVREMLGTCAHRQNGNHGRGWPVCADVGGWRTDEGGTVRADSAASPWLIRMHAGRNFMAAASCAWLAAATRTSQLWEEGVRSSYFLPVKISMPTKWHLAWPCLPVLEVATSATCVCQGQGGAGCWQLHLYVGCAAWWYVCALCLWMQHAGPPFEAPPWCPCDLHFLRPQMDRTGGGEGACMALAAFSSLQLPPPLLPGLPSLPTLHGLPLMTM